MIPAERIHPQAAEQLIVYLSEQIRQSLSARQPLEAKWTLWHQMYRGMPEFEVKEFPYLGAANLVIPIIATNVDITFSKLMGMLFGPQKLMSVLPLRSDMVDFAPRLEEFLGVVQDRELGAYDAVADFMLDVCKLGTGILKQRYKRETKTVYEFRETPQGVQEQIRRMMTSNHPELRHVSLWDFLIPPTAETIKDAPWSAERVTLTWQQFINRVQGGIYTGADRIGPWMANFQGSRLPRELMRIERYEPGIGNLLEVWECWLDFDIGGQGDPQAIVATIHMPTMTYLRIDYNPFFNQDKPYSAARYMRQEKRFLGIGLAEMLEHFQDEITAMHNQRIDSGTLANSTMFKGRKGVISQDEPIYPGRWFLLDDMEDVQPLALGHPGKFDSSLQYEEATLRYARERSGVNEYITGAATPSVGYAALGTNIQQAAQATQRFDQVLREVRGAIGESITRCVELYQQFDSRGKEFMYLGQEDGQIIHDFLQFPTELIRMGVSIEVTATSASLSKEVEIRTNTLVMQMLSQFYEQMLGVMQIALNPQVPPPMRNVAMLMMQGGSVMMRKILDSHGLQDIDQLVPRFQEMLNGQQASIGSIAGGPPGISGLGPAPGLVSNGITPSEAGGIFGQPSGVF